MSKTYPAEALGSVGRIRYGNAGLVAGFEPSNVVVPLDTAESHHHQKNVRAKAVKKADAILRRRGVGTIEKCGRALSQSTPVKTEAGILRRLTWAELETAAGGFS